MTIAPEAEPLIVSTPDEAITALRGSGFRLSTVRRLIIERLFAGDGPTSAANLARALSLEESSVYRNLELLERRGLVRHVHLGHGAGLYALVGRDDGEYLYCEACGRVTVSAARELEPVRTHIQRHFALSPRFTHFAIVGICDDCAARGAGRG